MIIPSFDLTLTDCFAFGTAMLSTSRLAYGWLEKRGTISKIQEAISDGQLTPEEAEELRRILLADTLESAVAVLKRPEKE